MRRITILQLLLAFAINGQAQFTVQKYYEANGTAWRNIEQLSSGNLFTGIAYGSGVSIMDTHGNIIQSHNFAGNPFTVMQSARKHTDNEFYFVCGAIADSCSTTGGFGVDPVIGKMDSSGNILALHRYELNAVACINTATDLVITSDGGAVAWGREESLFALRVNQNGDPLWSKQFDHNGSFAFIRELPSGDLLAGFNMDTAGVSVARLTAAGEFLWCKSYVRPRGNIRDCLIESDSVFIVTGYTDSIGGTNALIPLPPDYQPKLFMMQLNGDGDVQWCKGYAGQPRWLARAGGQHIVKTLDNQYVLLATIGQPDYQLTYRPFLMKTDPNGDTLWTRSVGGTDYTYGTGYLMAASDGGFYYDGVALGDFGQWSSADYLFKTDSLGHLPCHERTHPVEVVDLFPTDSSFTLNAVEGAVAIPGSNSEVTYDPIVVFDGCTFATSLPPRRFDPKRMRAQPNPNTGRFTLVFSDPLQAESYYSVYDATGKLLYQRPLPAGKGTEEVDLSRYGKGTYVIKCTDKDGVYHQRVVVE